MEKRETGRGSERTRFGLLVGTPSDLTDGLETLAALQFLPTVSEILDRYDPHEPSERTYVIANGTLWADTAGTTLADRPNIVPLLVSVGLPRGEDPSNPLVISNEAREYFAANGPIGCRDSTTVDVLAEAGVPAYLSGCLTMTFPEYNGRRSGSFVFVDVAEEVRDSVCRSLGVESMDIRTMTAQMPGLPGGLNRRFVRLRQMAEARRILRLCERSATVVTTHSEFAFAAASMGTPSLLVVDEQRHGDALGLQDLVHATTKEAILDDPALVQRSRDHVDVARKAMAEHLRWVCREFVHGTVP